MKNDYKQWLEEQGYATTTVNLQITRVKKVEEAYGSLDDHIRNYTLKDVINSLVYSAQDERDEKPNPSKITINAPPKKVLQSYKDAVIRYQKFTEGWKRGDYSPSQIEFVESKLPNKTIEDGIRFSFERDMQSALRNNISQLGNDLKIIDEGSERSVRSGFIDITCEDKQGYLVVVELKAGKADGKAIGQILGYMGDLAEEDEQEVAGILVAQEFDKRARAGARMVPNLKLVNYAISFKFTEQGY